LVDNLNYIIVQKDYHKKNQKDVQEQQKVLW